MKAAKRKSAVSARAKIRASRHPYQEHMDRIRSLVHSELANAGVNNLALRSMQFGPAINCKEGQHLAKVCTTDGSGKQTCVWKCVPN
jgi:hypothetical protein